ncbi:diguanylate cyclase [Poseidonibacter parvus]|uniref:histidine kinase n=1 Tax=Poseidonibacter parvus TaxID=1850254 RepID=A0A1P8KPW9_9BACT|nr:FIST N-terminal domain-containing protein [Poseidonibacter parvus]APW66590.1 diguanylate cyclase [Poseidonibacter parvus]
MKTYNYKLKNENIQDIINFDLFKNKENILIQVFCGQEKSRLQETVDSLFSFLPNAFCIGTTTNGEIYEGEVTSFSIIISISIFEETFIKESFQTQKSSFQKGLQLAKELITPNTKLLILFTDALHTNADELLKGIKEINPSVMIAGAIAGDNSNFKNTYISSGNKVFDNGTVGISLNSDNLNVQNDSRFNWSPIGIEHKITKAVDNRVYEINNIKAISFYEKYLGKEFSDLFLQNSIAFPLLIKNNNSYIARAALKLFEDGSLEFSGNLKEGQKVKFGFGNAEMILKDPIIPYDKDYSDIQSFFIYSCVARKIFVGDSINKENSAYSSIANTAGFFSYGEFYYEKENTKLLNQCFTMVALKESITNKNINSNLNQKNKNITSSKYSKTMQTLTHLIEQSSKDYDEQSKHLEIEKINSQMLLTSQKIFLRHAVHETNTPISVIMSNIELYEMEHGKNSYLSTIEVALKNIFNIYDDLSYLVKKDQFNYPKRDIDFVDYIRSRIDFFNLSAKQFGSNIVFNSMFKTLTFNFNETKLQRIIDNNLTNAIKYTQENSNIYITLTKEENSHILTFSSCSQYIQNPQKVFKEYYREESIKEGFGLGLSLVKRICDEENVDIKVESNEFYTSFNYIFNLEAK